MTGVRSTCDTTEWVVPMLRVPCGKIDPGEEPVVEGREAEGGRQRRSWRMLTFDKGLNSKKKSSPQSVDSDYLNLAREPLKRDKHSHMI